jgi:hypothetical protein
MNKLTQDLFQGFPFPKTSEQEVLLTLILQGYVSIFDHSYLSGFRTRVSQLKSIHGLTLETKKDTKTNKFGNQYIYSIHLLPEPEKQKAIDLYYKLNSRN